MALKEKLAQDLKDAMRDKDAVRKNVVQLVRSSVLQVEKDNKITLDDDGILDVIAKQLKQRRDSLPDYEKSGREDLILQLKTEMAILMEYLPAQLTHEELEVIVKEAVDATGATSMKDMGKVMGAVSSKVRGRADNRVVSGFVKSLLSK